MTRLARRNKTRWVRRMRRRGLAYRLGRLWLRWRWAKAPGLSARDLPVYHADYEGDWDGVCRDHPGRWPRAWRCLRCGAGQEWISTRRTRCLRCGAGREWLTKDGGR
jgi:hypothetical protein